MEDGVGDSTGSRTYAAVGGSLIATKRPCHGGHKAKVPWATGRTTWLVRHRQDQTWQWRILIEFKTLPGHFIYITLILP